MINHIKQSQLIINQEQLNHRHNQILIYHQELENKCGNIESDIIGLVIKLEQNGFFVRPWTRIHRMLNTAIVTLGLNPSSDCDLNSIETLALEFSSQFEYTLEVRID